jgi:hypothetical protein
LLHWDGSSWISANSGGWSRASDLGTFPAVEVRPPRPGEATAASNVEPPPMFIPPTPVPVRPSYNTYPPPTYYGNPYRYSGPTYNFPGYVAPPTPVPRALYHVSMSSPNAGVAVGDKRFLLAWNGISWRSIPAPAEAEEDTPFLRAASISTDRFLVCRRQPSPDGALVYRWDGEALRRVSLPFGKNQVQQVRDFKAFTADHFVLLVVAGDEETPCTRVYRFESDAISAVGGRLPIDVTSLDLLPSGEGLAAGAAIHHLAQ